MAEDFESILRAGAAEHAERTEPLPAKVVRARGDRLRRRRRTATAALAGALIAVVGGGALFLVGPIHHGPQPPAAATRTTTNAPSHPAATTSPPGPSRPSTGSTSSTHTASCASLVVPQAVKDAVTQAYRRSHPHLVHIAPVKGTFYYGQCGSTSYAGTRFRPTPGATTDEQVSLQDEGSAEKYFVKSSGDAWSYMASDGFPPDPRGCAVIHRIPAPLSTLWAGCRQQ